MEKAHIDRILLTRIRGPKLRGSKMRQRKHRAKSILSSIMWEPAGLDAGPIEFAEVLCYDGAGKVVCD